MNLAAAISIGIGTVVLALGLLRLFVRGSSSEDLGMVSNQWVAQHRAAHFDDPRR